MSKNSNGWNTEKSTVPVGKFIAFIVLVGVLFVVAPPLGLIVAIGMGKKLFASNGSSPKAAPRQKPAAWAQHDQDMEDSYLFDDDEDDESAHDFLFAGQETDAFSFTDSEHRHIVESGLSIEKRLEQLKVHYEAGLYTKEEYHQARRKILSTYVPSRNEE